MLRAALVPCLVVATLAACAPDDPEPPSPAISASTLRPGHVEKIVNARVDMTITGARPLTLKDEPAVLRMVIIEGDRNPQITHFFSISSGTPITLDDTTYLQFDADLAPGIYNGPGTYQLTTEPPKVGGTQGSLESAAYVQYLDLKPKPLGPKFDTIAKPCTLTVRGTAGTSGTVDCPVLKSQTGLQVAWHWEWELV